MGVHMLEFDPSGHRMPSEVEKGVEICSFFPSFMPQLHAFFNDLRVVPGTYYVL